MKLLSIRVPDLLDAKLTQTAKQRGKSKSVLIRDAVETYLANKQEGSENSFLTLAKDFVGSVKGPKDLSFNKEHLKGYGQR